MTLTTTTPSLVGRSVLCFAGFAVMLSCATGSLAQAPTPVRVDAVRMETVQERRQITGEIRAIHRAQVASEEQGILAELLVVEGDHVEADAPLARIDSHRLELALTGREADLRAAEATVAQRKAELEMRRRDLERLEKAVRSGAANEKEAMDARSDVSGAEAALAEAESRAASISATIELVQTRLQDMTIRAPFAGVVVARHVEKGEWLDSGDPVVEVLSLDPLEAWLDAPQGLLPAALANEARIEIIDSRTGRTIANEHGRVIPLVDPRARTFSLVAPVSNESGDIAPGVAVLGSAPTGRAVERLTINRDAVLRNEAGPYVYVLRGEDEETPATAQIAPISPLFDHEGRLVIEFGPLLEGDRLVVEGNERLFPNAPVTVAEQDGSAAPAGGVARRAESTEDGG